VYSAAVDQAFAAWQAIHVPALVDDIVRRHSVTKRRVAAALGITPSYLSNLGAGDKNASQTLLRLLHAFAASPKEFQHALRGDPLDDVDTWGMWSTVANARNDVRSFVYASSLASTARGPEPQQQSLMQWLTLRLASHSATTANVEGRVDTVDVATKRVA
jgi:hypothetical protein